MGIITTAMVVGTGDSVFYLIKTFSNNLLVFRDVDQNDSEVLFVSTLRLRGDCIHKGIHTLYPKVDLFSAYIGRIQRAETLEELQEIAILEALND